MDNTNQQQNQVNYKEETTRMLKEKLAYFLIGLSAIILVIAGSLVFLQSTGKGSSSSILNNVLGNNSQPTIAEQIARKQKAEQEAENRMKDIVGKERSIAIIRGIKPTLTVKDLVMVSPIVTPVVEKPTVTKTLTATTKPTNSVIPTQKPTATITNAPTPTATITKSPSPTAIVKSPSTVVTPKGATTYTVQSGDYLWQIAEKFYGDGFKAYDIAKANNISTPSQIYRGTVLKLPTLKSTVAPTVAQVIRQPEQGQISTGAQTGKVTMTANTYTVQSGDSLWSIAEAAYGDGYSWTRIAKANNIVNPGLIFKGTKLTIPRN